MTFSWLWGTCFPCLIISPCFYTYGRAWSYLNFMCHAKFKPMGGLPISEFCYSVSLQGKGMGPRENGYQLRIPI